jgi:hypothetical protein
MQWLRKRTSVEGGQPSGQGMKIVSSKNIQHFKGASIKPYILTTPKTLKTFNPEIQLKPKIR